MIAHHDESTGQDTYRSGATPWFGLRLRCGNSLVGARRAVWTREQLKSGAHVKKSGENAAPRLLAPGEQRAEGEIYHFLVFDEEMVPTHRDSLMRSFHPERAEAAKTWVTRHVKPKWSVDQIATALAVSDLVDEQMQRYAEARIAALAATDCTASVWPTPANDPQATDPGPKLVDQERICAELESDSSAFQRLRLVMDLWCALWFWPLEEVTSLPDREAFLESSRMLLAGEPISDQSSKAMANIRLGFDIDMLRSVVGEGVPDVRQLADVVPWFTVADRVRSEQTFHHWELAFPEVLGPSVASGGFDLIVGNPPWIKASWSDGSVLAELEPMLGVKESASAALNRERPKVLSDDEGKSEQARIASGSRGEKQCPRCFYGEAFRKQEGVSTFLNSPRLYPELVGMKANLYKNFIVRSWGLTSHRGAIGLLHPEGPYDDAGGGKFRKAIYPRLRGHYHHKNELQLFSDVDHHTDYSINIYGPYRDAISFNHVSNLFHPATIAASFGHEQIDDPIPGIKDNDEKWNVRPHSQRIVRVTERELTLFAALLEDDNSDQLTSRLPQVHSVPLVNVIEKITKAPNQLGDFSDSYFATQMYNEVNSQRDGSIMRQENPSYQPEATNDWVVSGPHFFVGTPFNKTPRTACTHNNAYDDIDLTVIGPDYLPRAVYRPGNESGDRSIFEESVPCWPPTRLPGLWPIKPEQHAAWEVILGQPPVIHTAAGDLSVLSISECSSDVLAALSHLAQIETPTREELAKHFPGVYAKQCEPAPGALEHLRQPITTRYRYANREMVSIGTERTLLSTILPPGSTQINTVFSLLFEKLESVVIFTGCTTSVVYDFIVKSLGKGHCNISTCSLFPFPSGPLVPYIVNRTLRLTCLTAAYADLWTSVAETSIDEDAFTVDGVQCESPSPQAGQDGIPSGPLELAWRDLDPTVWTWNTPLRSDRARRQALLEIDVLVAMSLGLILEELLQIYQVQFPVMQMYERVDEYDRHGRHLPNTKRKDQGGKGFRTVTWPINDGKETCTRDFHPPFFKVDREEDYRRAWEAFASRNV